MTRVAVTGTPGTGKTTATADLRLPVIHLNEAIREAGLHDGRDPDRDSLYADFEAVEAWLDANAPDDDHVVESHLAHHLPADRVVVLRCRPDVIESRLRERGESAASARENAESEALDAVLAGAVEERGADGVYELDATDLTPGEVAAEIEAVVAGERDPRAGVVDFTDSLDVAADLDARTTPGSDPEDPEPDAGSTPPDDRDGDGGV